MKNIKKWLLIVSCLAMLLSATGAYAYDFSDDYPLYKVESYSPNGYCYLYDQPSDIKGRNLGRYNNEAFMKVVDFNYKNGYALVICTDGKVGYVHNYSITPYLDTINRELCRVYSVEPRGYCYMYDEPSDIRGVNMGRYNNGAVFQIVDWDADETFAKVKSWDDDRYGYVRKTCLKRDFLSSPYEQVGYVESYEPKGYCYLYDQPSSVKGRNLGRHNNGEKVYIIDWDGDANYALVECENGEIGYMNKKSLTR